MCALVACSMASAGFAACMGATPETVLQVRTRSLRTLNDLDG